MHVMLIRLDKQLDPVPADNDVVAGWTGFAVFVGLAIAIAVIGWALNRSLRRARRSAAEGKFDPSLEDGAGHGSPASGRDG